MSQLYPGKELPGLDRVAGHFMDGIFIKYCMVVNHHVEAFDQFGTSIYRDPTPLPEGFVPKSLGCIRSAQTGKLIVVIGGFTAGTSTQVTHILATDYFITPPAVYQG